MDARIQKIRKIRDLLSNLNSDDSLKKLFWSELGFNRVNAPINPRLLPESIQPLVLRMTLFAEFFDLTIIYLCLNSANFSQSICSQALSSIRGKFSECLLVTSNNIQTDWAFSFAFYDSESKLRTRLIRISAERDTYDLARGLLNSDFAGIGDKAEEGLVTETGASIAATEHLEGIFEDEAIKARMKPRRKSLSLEEMYSADITRYKLLSPDEEKDLIQKIEETRSDPTTCIPNRNRLIEHNLRLVFFVINRYHLKGCEEIDLVQAGNLGLIEAAKKFDISEGNKFSTYAVYWIRQSMTRSIANFSNGIRLPVHKFEEVRRLWAIKAKLALEMTSNPSLEDWAEAAEIDENKLQELLLTPRITSSLYDAVNEDGGTTLLELFKNKVSCEPRWLQEINLSELRDLLETAMENLKPNFRQVIRLRYGLEDGEKKTLKEVAEIIELTRERVRQIERAALRTLAKRLDKSTTLY